MMRLKLPAAGDGCEQGGEGGCRTCEETPSTTSTRTRAPSTRRDAVDTSLEKSTCPGVSIMFMTYVLGLLPKSSLSPTQLRLHALWGARTAVCRLFQHFKP